MLDFSIPHGNSLLLLNVPLILFLLLRHPQYYQSRHPQHQPRQVHNLDRHHLQIPVGQHLDLLLLLLLLLLPLHRHCVWLLCHHLLLLFLLLFLLRSLLLLLPLLLLLLLLLPLLYSLIIQVQFDELYLVLIPPVLLFSFYIFLIFRRGTL